MQPNPSPRRRSRRTLPASAYPGASPPTAVRCAQQPAEADLTEATLPRNESHDNMETVDARRAANTRRFVGCLRRACLGCFAIYACCVVLFLATVTPAPDGWDAQATLRTFSQMTASCFGTAALLNLLAVAFEDESVLGDGSPSARARVAPFTCIFVINVVSCASHAAIALDLLPRHVMFDGRVFHSARWAEWCALVPLLMVLMHALNFDPNGDEDAPVLDAAAVRSIVAQEASTVLGCACSLWDPPAPVALACLLLSTAAYCHIFVVLGDVLAKAKAAYDEKREDRKGDRPAKSFSRDVAAAGRRLRLARAALLTVVCAGTWTLFVVVYFSGLFRLVSPLYEGLLYNVVDVVAKCLYAGALGAAHSRALSPEHALRRLLQFEVEATTQRRRFLRYVMHEVRVPLNAVRLGVRAISDYVGYGRGQSPEGDRPSPVHALADGHSDATHHEAPPAFGGGLLEPALRSPAAPTTDADGEIQEVVEVVEASISCMSETLDDVLSFASIEEGRFTLHRKPFAVRDLVDQAVATHAPSARERGVALVTRVDDRLLDAWFDGDARRLGACVSNFVSNALKFTPEHADRPRVAVSVGLSDDEAPRDPAVPVAMVRVSVADDGVGIAPADQRRLFQAFSQIRAGELQQGRGSGLGLAISREIVQLHGGTIGVVSDVGRGSEFYFVIPLPVVDAAPSRTPSATDLSRPPSAGDLAGAAAPAVPAALPAPRKRRRGRRALVVDDVSSNRKLIAFHVRKLGFEVELAEDGAEAVAAHSRKRARTGGGAAPQDAADDGFDLILMDSVMPVMNGLDATRAIRAAGCDALIVGVTGNALAEDIAAFVAAGANCVVTKPVSVAQLKDELAKYGLAD